MFVPNKRLEPSLIFTGKAEAHPSKAPFKAVVDYRGQCYKAFYGCSVLMFVISSSVCPWQVFPDQSNVCG